MDRRKVKYAGRLIFAMIVAVYTPAAAGQEYRSQYATQMLQLMNSILDKMDDRVRPHLGVKTEQVACDFYVHSISSVNEVDMDFQIDVFFRMRWYVDYLKFDNFSEPVAIPAKYTQKFWIPDVIFNNEKTVTQHNFVTPNTVIKVFPTGLVRFSTRVTLKLECPMHLLHFPLDYQNCYVELSSFSHQTKDLELRWHDPAVEMNPQIGPFSLPQFEYLGFEEGVCSSTLSTGSFSCLIVRFRFRRLMGYYMLQAYIPSILIVVLSWLSFWISKEAVPARITLGVTTVLTMTTQLSSSRSTQMKVSYPKALDVWYAFCMIIVFGALVEYALVNVLIRVHTAVVQVQETREIVPASRNDTAVVVEEDDEDNPSSKLDTITAATPMLNSEDVQPPVAKEQAGQPTVSERLRTAWSQNIVVLRKRVLLPVETYATACGGRMTADGIDKCSRIIFPAAFILFNIIYWIVYTQEVVFFAHIFKET